MNNMLRDLRKSKGLTQEDLAKKANVSRSVIARFETGKTTLSAKNLIKIAGTLGVPMDYIMKGGQEDGAAS